MLKKKIIAAVLVLLMAISIGTGVVYAEEVYKETECNLVLEKGYQTSAQAVAGGRVHMKVGVRLKDGYCIEPEFFLKAPSGSSLSFENLKVTNGNDPKAQWVYIDETEFVVLEYDVVVDDFAKIGKYTYDISYNIPKDDYDEDGTLLDPHLIEPGNLTMEVFIVNEKIPPQMSVVRGTEQHVNAGGTLTLCFTIENQGELPALDTYVEADYLTFAEALVPNYTPLKQKIGTLSMGASKEMTFTYKIAEDAKTQVMKLPIDVTYKLANGEPGSYTAYIYIYVEGAEEKEKEDFVPIISGVKQSVEKPKAGEYVTVSFDLENRSSANIPNVRLDVQSVDSGFSVADNDPYIYIGTLKAGEKRNVEIKLLAGEDIAEGTYVQKITCYYSEDASYATEIRIKNVTNPEPKLMAPYVKNVKQSPAQPMAGEKLTVSFDLVNDGGVEIRDAKVLLPVLGETGFLPTSAEPYVHVGTIPAGSKKTVKLEVKVGEKIAEGFNQLGVNIEYLGLGSGGMYVKQEETATLYILDVKNPEEEEVTISRPKLMVSNFYTDVEEVKAGSVFDFTFDILNTNDSIDAKNIKVTVTGASNAFSVTAGGNSFFVNAIKAQETAPITINLKASAAATTGAYPIQIKIEYEYEGMIATDTYSGEVVDEEILLQVKENLRPSVENVYVGSWDTPMVNQPTAMNFEFYNMGKSTLNNTYVTVEGDFMLANGSNSYYIGNIAAGMPEYIEFDVVPLIEGDAVGKMIIHMEDSNGDEVTMEKEFTAFVMGEMSWEDPGMMDPGMMDPGFVDPSMPVDGDTAKKPILPLWLFLCIQGAILVVVIPVTRALRLAAYRRKIKREDAI